MAAYLAVPYQPAGEPPPTCGDVFAGQLRSFVGVAGFSDGIYACAPGATTWAMIGTLAVEEGGVEEGRINRFDFDASDFNVNVTGAEAAIALAYGTGAGTPAEGNHTHPPPVISSALGVQTSVAAGDTIANSAAITAFATKVTIPAALFTVGAAFRLVARGVAGNNGGVNLNMRIRLGTVDLDSQTIAYSNAGTAGWEVTADVVVVAAGAGGTVECHGTWHLHRGQNSESFFTTAPVAVDLSAARDLALVVNWASANANNTITQRQLIVQRLNV